MTNTTPSLTSVLGDLSDDCAKLLREIDDREIELATRDAVQIGELVRDLIARIEAARDDAREEAEAAAEEEYAHRRSESLQSIFL